MAVGVRQVALAVLMVHRASAGANAVSGCPAVTADLARRTAVMARVTVLEAHPTATTVPAPWMAAMTRTRRLALDAHHAAALLVVATVWEVTHLVAAAWDAETLTRQAAATMAIHEARQVTHQVTRPAESSCPLRHREDRPCL